MTQPELSSNAQAILDQVLEGESPEQRAKVLRLVVELGINPEEEFFAIALALKHLQLIMLEGPEQWKNVGSAFLSELDVRVETAKQMLLAHTNNIEAISILANDVQEVQQSLKRLQESAIFLDQQFSQTVMLANSTLNQWQQTVIQFQEQRQFEAKYQSALLKEIVALHTELKRRPPDFLSKGSYAVIYSILLSVAGAAGTGILVAKIIGWI